MERLKPSEHYSGELEALRESERRFRAIYEQAPIGMTLVDIRTGRFVQCNVKFGEIVGRPPGELAGLKVLGLIFPEDVKRHLEGLEALKRGKSRSLTLEKRYVRPDGSVIWVSSTAVPMWAEGAKPDFYMALTEDIAGRKAVEEERRRQEMFDRLITEILGRFAFCTGAEIDREIRESLRVVGGFIHSEEVFVSLMSRDLRRWSVVYGWSESGKVDLCERYADMPMSGFPWEEQRLLAGEAVQVTGPEEWPPEAALDREFNEREGVQSLLMVPLRGRGGLVMGSVGLRTLSRRMQWTDEDLRRIRMVADAVANALERKRTEMALCDSRRMLEQVLNTILQRVFWKDLHSRFLGCNEPFARDAGLSGPDEVIGKTAVQIWGLENAARYEEMDREVMETGKPRLNDEEQMVRSDGTVSWVRICKVPLRDYQNRIFGVLGTYEDITALRQARVAMERATQAAVAANQAKDQFIAVLSHELRTPLTPVLAMVTALEESEELPERWREDFVTIHRNVELEARLIDDLLDITRISQGKLILKPECVDAHSCLRTALQICVAELEAKRQKLELRLEARRHFVKADAVRLRQVFWNLIQNAVKFTPEGGKIEIRSCNEEGRLKVVVRDNGIGIAPEVLPRVFNAFEQGEVSRKRRFGGLGLGLSIARMLVEMHHGTLTAASEGRGRGAEFTLELAVVDEHPGKGAAAPVCPGECARARRILLVDDHEDTLRILSRLLRKWGYGVTTAGNVEAACTRLSEARFDLMVSDLGLPDGSGLDIMRRAGKRFPAIALSGYGTDEDIRASLEAGFSEHLVKPVSFQALRAAVEHFLPGKPS